VAAVSAGPRRGLQSPLGPARLRSAENRRAVTPVSVKGMPRAPQEGLPGDWLEFLL
jgi:hypothetical protein